MRLIKSSTSTTRRAISTRIYLLSTYFQHRTTLLHPPAHTFGMCSVHKTGGHLHAPTQDPTYAHISLAPQEPTPPHHRHIIIQIPSQHIVAGYTHTHIHA